MALILQEFDLTKGETVASTTAYGLDFVEQMRRTADKRQVMPLPPGSAHCSAMS